jgi:predicted MFS family arabinose efflux permease
VIGGILVGLAGWRLVFWFNLAAGLLVMLAALVTVPESADPVPSHVDAAGFVLGPLALGTAIFAVIHGETTGYSDPAVIALFAVSAVTALLFVAVERRSADPIFDVAYLRRGSFTGSLAVAFAAYFGVFSIFFFTALYLQVVVGYSAYRTAALFVPMAIAMIAASALTGRWVARSGPRLPTVLGCLAAGAGMVATDAALRGHVGFATLAPALALAGLGFGVAVVPVTSVALAIIPAEHSGMAAGATTTSRELGAVVGVAVLGSLVNGHLTIDLTRRLAGLGVPAGFRDVVITAVETGQVPKGGAGGAAAAAQAFGPIVAKVIDAAYGAFRAGLTISLLLAGAVILVSGLVAWFTLAPGPSQP